MSILNFIFTFYDGFIASFPTGAQFFISLILLFLIVWSLFSILRQGHWIFVAIFVILFPSAWPAMRTIALIIWSIIKFLLVRIQINL